ncbi:enzymatic polyprotein [Striga asiatica]|uniref:Enzymatic polyprotein n=1 Tax=Striga asiatica TaxID=4170 RepID=A0A5A7QR85_STRAF|nr:enzymatic polyprotein [Striga asiatica]
MSQVEESNEMLEKQLEELSKLMAAFDLGKNHVNSDDEKSENQNDLVYGFSSDDEFEDEPTDNPFNVKIEEGESSKNPFKRKRTIGQEKEFYRQKFERIPKRYVPEHHVCSDHPLDSLKNTNQELVVINLKDPHKEVNVPNRIPYTIRDVEEFQQECQDLLSKNLIRESASPHSALAFYVENHNEIKRGKRLMVINYKKMNEATIGDSYKLPRKDFIFEKIKGSKWFSSLDAKSGYYQLRLSEETKPLTAFSCPPQKHYKWNVLSFGLKQAPSIYQRFMDKSLEGLEHICLAYIDDILISSKGSKEEHIFDVQKVLTRVKEKGIVISKKKSKLVQTEIEYLRTIIKEDGKIDLSPHTQEKILAFPNVFENRKQIQRFLGCLNYISNEGYFKDLSTDRKVVQKKFSDKVPWSWTDSDSEVVKKIKSKIITLPQLYNPTNDDFQIIETDASQHVWAGCMRALPNGKKKLSLDEQGKSIALSGQTDLSDRPLKISAEFEKQLLLCRYTSGTFSDTETRYPIAELEVLAGVRVLEKWKIDLHLPDFYYEQIPNTLQERKTDTVAIATATIPAIPGVDQIGEKSVRGHTDKIMEQEMKQLQHQLKQRDEQIQAAQKRFNSLFSQRGEIEETIKNLENFNIPEETQKEVQTSEPIKVAQVQAQQQTKETNSPPEKEKVQKEVSTSRLSSQTLEKNPPPKQEKVQTEDSPSKEAYVIFDGPTKGVYKNWNIAKLHIIGKPVRHQKYPTYEDALKAYKKAYHTVSTDPDLQTDRSLGYSRRIATQQLIQKNWKWLTEYSEEFTQECFYPTNSATGAKANWKNFRDVRVGYPAFQSNWTDGDHGTYLESRDLKYSSKSMDVSRWDIE